MTRHTELAVVGAGPAGLAAAAEAARLGAKVTVFDEGRQPGGRLLVQDYTFRLPGGELYEWQGLNVAAELASEAVAAGVELRLNTSVWGAFAGPTIGIRPATMTGPEEGASSLVTCDALLIATGASERPLPVPGWTLPGVMTAGGAEAMLNIHGVRPGNRALVVGPDPLGILVAQQLVAHDIDVVGVVVPHPGSPGSPYGDLPEVLAALARAGSAVGPNALVRRLAAPFTSPDLAKRVLPLFPVSGVSISGVKIKLRQALVEVRGQESVEEVVLAPLSAGGELGQGTRAVRVDMVCLSGGLSPLAELAASAGCRCSNIFELGGVVPLHGRDSATTVDRVFVTGNVTGIESAPAAIEQGRLAGTQVAAALGHVASDKARRLAAEREMLLRKARESVVVDLNPMAPQGRLKLRQHWQNAAAKNTATTS